MKLFRKEVARRKSLDKKVEKQNHIDKLDIILKSKFDKFFCAESGTAASEILSWEQFEEIFSTVTVQFCFRYKDVEFTVFNCGKYSEFWIDGDDANTYRRCDSPKALLQKVEIDGRTFEDIWNETTLNRGKEKKEN